MSDDGVAESAPCQCHQNFAYTVPMHSGHCCFYPATQSCHAEEVAQWLNRRDGMATQ